MNKDDMQKIARVRRILEQMDWVANELPLGSQTLAQLHALASDLVFTTGRENNGRS